MSHSRKKIDLTGKVFGKLKVLGPAPNIGNRTAWYCQCECGKVIQIRTTSLRNRGVRSCGCIYAGSLKGLHYIDGTCIEMIKNKRVRSNNTSGVTGVIWRESRKKWEAAIMFKGVNYRLGSFEDFDEAVAARKRAESELHDKFVSDYLRQHE